MAPKKKSVSAIAKKRNLHRAMSDADSITKSTRIEWNANDWPFPRVSCKCALMYGHWCARGAYKCAMQLNAGECISAQILVFFSQTHKTHNYLEPEHE